MALPDKADATRWSDIARQKAEIIMPLLYLSPIPPDVMYQAQQKAGELLGTEPVPKRTLYQWLRQYRELGVSGLERRQRKTTGESSVHPDIRQYIIDLLKDSKNYSLTRVVEMAQARAETTELIPPTYNQVRFIDRQMSDAAKLQGVSGTRAYRNKHELVGRFEASAPNEMWQSDHHLCDILILNPLTGKAERPWLTVFLDDHTRSIMGIHLSFDNGSSNSIALALRHALLPKTQEQWLQCGIPRTIYIDNGKDFRSKHIAEACLHFRIEQRFHEPYNPRSKGKIERWFRTLEEMCLKYHDGYVGSDPKSRPRNVQPKLSLEELYGIIAHFIIDVYHQRTHSEMKESPYQRWLKSTTVIEQVPVSDDLDYLLESAGERQVRQDGIMFNNQLYNDPSGGLGPLIGKKVWVFFDRLDKSSIRVRYSDEQGDRAVCTAITNVSSTMLAPHNNAVRRELGKDAKASRQRVQQAQKDVAQKDSQSSQRPADAARPAIPPKPQPQQPQVLRYRFELEDDDDD